MLKVIRALIDILDRKHTFISLLTLAEFKIFGLPVLDDCPLIDDPLVAVLENLDLFIRDLSTKELP